MQKAPAFLRTYSSAFTTSLQLVGNHGIYCELAHCISTLTAFARLTKLGRPDTLDRPTAMSNPHMQGNTLFAWLISRTFSANEQCFSLTTNQQTVLSAMAFQPSEQGEK
jgi:hypothetical protein